MRIYGPYKRKDGREHIIKIDNDGKRTTQSYPRYLMEQHLGRKLESYEVIDHIDENPFNNTLENLQILSQQENVAKSTPVRSMTTFVCPVCGKIANKLTNHVKHNRNMGKRGPYCSRQCAGKAGRKV